MSLALESLTTFGPKACCAGIECNHLELCSDNKAIIEASRRA